jgi:hypothetical protein
MNITIIINEEQKKRILLESSGESMSELIKKNYEFTKDILKKSSSQIGINFEFLITWGASIGGFVGPLNDFIANIHPEFSDLDISLLLTGIITSYYVDNKEMTKNVYHKIKERGLFGAFKTLLKKSEELKLVFFAFVESLGITLHKVTNILSYTFVIPLIPMLYSLAQEGFNGDEEIHEIIKRLSGFGLLTVSGILSKELITKMIKRFNKN